MSTEKYIGEAALKSNPKVKLNLNLREGCITTEKLADSSVTTEKIAKEAVTTEKIAEKAITNSKVMENAITVEKIADNSISTSKLQNASVINSKLANDSVTSQKIKAGEVKEVNLGSSSVTTSKLSQQAVTTEKLKDGNVTNQKMAADTLTIDKFDPELRKTLQAATGLPEEFIQMIQDVDKSLDKLNDTVYPITLGFSLSPNVSIMETKVSYSVSNEGKPYTPDALSVTKKVNDAEAKVIANTPVSSGSVTTPIEGNRETFVYTVGKSGRTGKSTSQTRYLCYYGSSTTDAISEVLLNALGKVSTTGVSFNPSITTKDGEYIWLVVPNYLGINRVTSAGFDVTLAAVQSIKTSLGTFKAYRTANSLTANKWNLVIS